MDFFESLPDPPPVQPNKDANGDHGTPWVRPRWEIAGSAAAVVLLIHTGDVAVALTDFHAFTNGFEFTMRALCRQPQTGSRAPNAPPIVRAGQHPGTGYQQVLRLGLLYADGRHGAKGRLAGPQLRQPPPAGEIVIAGSGSSGNPQEWTQDFFVHPLPPERPLTFITTWLAHDITETRAQIDSAVIRDAAQQAVRLWPDDVGPDVS